MREREREREETDRAAIFWVIRQETMREREREETDRAALNRQ
jgi:hypothetical protein